MALLIGNAYEEFSFPEGVDVAQVMGEQGFEDVARAILRTSLTRPGTATRTGRWARSCSARRRTSASSATARTSTPRRPRCAATSPRSAGRSTRARPALLGRERYSSDIHDPVYGLHSQAVVWAGLRGMADAWAQTGQARARRAPPRARRAARGGLRRAVRESQRRLPDGSLFVPMRLLGGEEPYAR